MNPLTEKIHSAHKKMSYSNSNMEIYSAQDFKFNSLGTHAEKKNHPKTERKSGWCQTALYSYSF